MRALGSAEMLAPEAPEAVLALLRSETRRFITTPWFGKRCRRLAVELLEHRDIGADDATLILERAAGENGNNSRKELDMALTNKKAVPVDGLGGEIRADVLYRAWQAFINDATEGVAVQKGQTFRGDHAVVRSAPAYFVPDEVAERDQPTVWDTIVNEVDAGVAAAAEETRVKLGAARPPRLYRLREDRVIEHKGRVTTFEKGSLAAEGDVIVDQIGAAYWEVVTP